MTKLFKDNSNAIIFMTIFGVSLSALLGFPLGTVVGLIMGFAIGRRLDEEEE